jgi:hypothetical protein
LRYRGKFCITVTAGLSELIPLRSSMFFRIIPKFMEQIKNSITPMGIKNTALEIINLVEIFSLEKNIFPPYPILRSFKELTNSILSRNFVFVNTHL